MARGGERHQRRPWGGGEENMAVAVARHEAFMIDRQERPGRIGLGAGVPVLAQLEEEPLAVDARIRILGLWHLHELAIAELKHVVGPERLLANVKLALEAGGRILEAGDRHVVIGAFVDELRVGELRSPLPHPNGARIAGGRHRASAEIGADQERVGIAPRHPALRLGKLEAPRHEGLRLEIVFPDHLGIGTAARQLHKATLVVRLEDGDTVPNPILFLTLSEGVEIDHRLPSWLRFAVFLEARPPPHPLGVLGIAPEVVEVLPDLSHHRDPVLRVEDRENPFFERPEGVVVGKRRGHLRVALLHPLQLLLASDILEPLIGIGGRGGRRVGRAGCVGHGEGERGGEDREKTVVERLHHRTASGGVDSQGRAAATTASAPCR